MPVPAVRSDPAAVDGDLTVLSPDALARIQTEIDRIDGGGYFGHLPPAAAVRARRLHLERQQAQQVLRGQVERWMNGRNDHREAMRRFYLSYGVDVMTLKTLGSRKALKLAGKIANDIN